MDTLATVIIACLGSSGLFAVIQLLLSRLFSKHDNRDENSKSLKRLAERADTGDLNDSRIQLLILINHYPKCHTEILKEAEHYFVDLCGDSWVASIVMNWAVQEGVDIEYIKRAHEATLASRKTK